MISFLRIRILLLFFWITRLIDYASFLKGFHKRILIILHIIDQLLQRLPLIPTNRLQSWLHLLNLSILNTFKVHLDILHRITQPRFNCCISTVITITWPIPAHHMITVDFQSFLFIIKTWVLRVNPSFEIRFPCIHLRIVATILIHHIS